MEDTDSKDLDQALGEMESNLNNVIGVIDQLQKGQKKSAEAGEDTMQ